MNSLRDIYRRFKRNYRTDTGGINLYPQFDSDLEQLIDYVGVLLGEASFKDKVIQVDCGWIEPKRKENE